MKCKNNTILTKNETLHQHPPLKILDAHPLWHHWRWAKQKYHLLFSKSYVTTCSIRNFGCPFATKKMRQTTKNLQPNVTLIEFSFYQTWHSWYIVIHKGNSSLTDYTHSILFQLVANDGQPPYFSCHYLTYCEFKLLCVLITWLAGVELHVSWNQRKYILIKCTF